MIVLGKDVNMYKKVKNRMVLVILAFRRALVSHDLFEFILDLSNAVAL